MSKSLYNFGCINLFIAVFCFAIMIAPIAAAQEGESDASAPKHSLKDGAWALQLGLPALSRGGYDDPEFSMKYHLSDLRAIRLGIEVDGLISFGNSHDYRGQTEPDSLTDFREFDNDTQGFRVDAEYISYGPHKSDLYFFWGAGPLLEFRRQFEKSVDLRYYYDGPRRNVTESKSIQWALGMSGTVGAEWFLLKRVSILGEYGISVEYRYYTRDMNAISSYGDFRSRRKYHSNSFDLDLKKSRIALSIYL